MLASLLKRLLHRGAARAPEPAPQARDGVPYAGNNWLNEALQLRQLGRHREIIAICRSVLTRQPDNTDALNLLASALLAQGESREGIACLRRVAELVPDSAETFANLAAALAATGDAPGAVDNYRHAVSLRPDFAKAWSNLAALLKALGRYDEAEECCRSGLRSDAEHAALHHTLANALFEQGRVDAAIAEIRAALALNPDTPAVHSELLRMLNYADAQDPVAVYREYRAWAERHARPLEDAALPHNNNPDPTRRLRVGYVSPYFRKHAVTFFLESVIQHHDRSNFEVILYADVAQPDEYSERLQAHGAIWRKTVGMSHERLAWMVRNDAIDILVDLSGHTANNRLLAFARRSAPVQVTWNGYPNTTGMASMDYRITDAYCDPPGTTEHLHTERLVRMPGIYMAWRPPDQSPGVGPLPALESGRVTFGSFNSCYKITPGLIALWARILRQVPGSRFMMLTIDSGIAERRVRDLLTGNGIDPKRLDILPRLTHEEFLTAHQRADIALDAFPYHGTTTTCFSLWMGLPVVVLGGATHVSRVGVSMLSNVGLPQWVAHNDDEYVETATRLAADLPGLAKTRAGLRGMLLQSPNTDGRSCARNLESAYREMWVTWCRMRGKTVAEAPRS
jgi:predicted O-linked N-acetylglucosamine transferase (SPINDLY family)